MNDNLKRIPYIVSCLKDNTLYNKNNLYNYGLLPNLFLISTLSYKSNIIMKFNTDQLPTSSLSGSLKAILNIYNYSSVLSSYNYTVSIAPLNKYWLMGINNQDVLLLTVQYSNWDYPTINQTSSWNGGLQNIVSLYKIDEVFLYTTLLGYQDLNVNITDIVNYWINSTNLGLVIFILSNDVDVYNKYYSKETNSIYEPNIIIYKNIILNFSPSTSELLVTFNNNIFSKSISLAYIYINNLKKTYFKDTITKLNISIFLRNFKKSFKNNNNNKIIINMYYRILDSISGKVVIDFDEKTKTNYTIENNYMYLNTSNFITNRYYKIIFKILSDEESLIYDTNQVFLVI